MEPIRARRQIGDEKSSAVCLPPSEGPPWEESEETAALAEDEERFLR